MKRRAAAIVCRQCHRKSLAAMANAEAANIGQEMTSGLPGGFVSDPAQRTKCILNDPNNVSAAMAQDHRAKC